MHVNKIPIFLPQQKPRNKVFIMGNSVWRVGANTTAIAGV